MRRLFVAKKTITVREGKLEKKSKGSTAEGKRVRECEGGGENGSDP